MTTEGALCYYASGIYNFSRVLLDYCKTSFQMTAELYQL